MSLECGPTQFNLFLKQYLLLQLHHRSQMSERLSNLSKSLKKQNRITQLRGSSKINKKQLFTTLIPTRISRHFEDVYKMIRDNPGIFQHADIEELSRVEQRRIGAKQTMTILNTLKIDLDEDQYRFLACMYAISFFGIGQTIKGLVQYLLYIKTLMVFKSNEYHEECLQRAKRFQDLGSFSLTEMHHGSFSRGIATEAIYDPTTKQFVISTNGEKGMKFWIGNTAQTANKTVVWAQLIVEGVNYGPHTFIMQLRDDKTHEVLPGIMIGDCGPKNGLNVIDNGYILIKDVRVPSKALLGKLGYVDDEGKYQTKVKTSEQRFGLHMSPLSSGRASLSLTCLSQSAAALTIAFRYACQRRQFSAGENTQETLIIDYPITRYRLLVPLASNIVSYFAAVEINRLYIENSQNFTDPTKKIVSELHAVSAVLKAKSSWLTNSIITECREVLGGHGYSAFSGLGRYYHDNDVNSTWEGDNNMLLQQTSKYLFKTIKLKQNGSILNTEFVYDGAQSIEPSEETLNNLSQLRTLLQGVFIHRFNTAVKEMSKVREELKKTGIKNEDVESYAWSQVQPYFCNEMALSYGDLIIFENLFKVIEHYKGTQHNKVFLSKCLKLWTQSTLLKASINGINTRKILQKLILEGVEAIYPDCIAVTDVLAPPSFVMGSPFAQEDGQGMKDYINLLFTGKKTFGRVAWFEKLTKLREEAN